MLNILSVVIGIAITFAVDDWISDRKEKKDIDAALRLVRHELMDNVEALDTLQSKMLDEMHAIDFLVAHYDGFEKADQDSLKMYCNKPLEVHAFSISSDALELLKNSALFQKIPDKELALDIIRCYRSLEAYKEAHEFANRKKERLAEQFTKAPALKALYAKVNFTAAEFWNAIISVDEGKEFLYEARVDLWGSMNYADVRREIVKVIDQMTYTEEQEP